MPRPIREGLDYFYKGVHDWDSFAVMDLVNQYGPIGYCVYDIVLGRVYENGYYLEIPIDKLARYVVRTVGNRWLSDRNSAEEIIRFCAEIGLFDRELLERSVVTSVEIQTHYASVAARRKVDKRKYWLLKDVSGNDKEEAAEKPHPTMKENMTATKTPVSAAITPVSASVMQQSRVNKSKANKSKENESKADESRADESRADESKADESKADESKANESKANESEKNKKRNGMKEAASAGFAAPAAAAAAAPENAVEEVFAAVPYAAAAAAAQTNAVEEVFAAVPYAAAAAAQENTVEEAFADVTGRLCNTRDREALTIMRQAGADDEMIARLIRKVGRRTHKSIGSMNYFIPVVREALQKSHQPRFAGHSNARAGLCGQTSDMEEIERLLDEEWEKETARYMLCSDTDDDYTYEYE